MTLPGKKDEEKKKCILPVICIEPEALKSSCLRPVPGYYVKLRVTNLDIIASGSILEGVIPRRIAIGRNWSGIFQKFEPKLNLINNKKYVVKLSVAFCGIVVFGNEPDGMCSCTEYCIKAL